MNNRISWGFHLPLSSFCLGRGWAACLASFFIFSSHLLVFMLDVSVSDVWLVWTELESDVKGCCKGWGTTSLPQFSGLNVSSFPRFPTTLNNSLVDQNRNSVNPAIFKPRWVRQQSSIQFITYYFCKYFHTVSSLRLFFLFCFINPSRVIWYGLDKYNNEGDTLLLHLSHPLLESPCSCWLGFSTICTFSCLL